MNGSACGAPLPRPPIRLSLLEKTVAALRGEIADAVVLTRLLRATIMCCFYRFDATARETCYS